MGPRVIFVLLAAILLCPSPAVAESGVEPEMAADVVHSDLPLFHGGENVWPQPFGEGDSFGCVSRVEFGDWVMREAGAEDGDDAQWYRIQNYGVFHCFATVGRAHRRDELQGAEFKPSFFVLLGTTRAGSQQVELWALQIGARPGSEYLLLSRTPGEDPVRTFNVLQTECPRSNVRDRGAMEILLTRYCAINTRVDFLRFARRMAQRPPCGALSLLESNASSGDRGSE